MNMSNKMSKNLVKRMIAGYKKVNKINAAEKHTLLENLSIEEAMKIFDDLHQKADDWKKHGGNVGVGKTMDRKQGQRPQDLYSPGQTAGFVVNLRFDAAWEIHPFLDNMLRDSGYDP